MSTWKIKVGTELKTLSELHVSAMRRRLLNQAADEVMIVCAGRPCDSDPVFEYDDLVEIFRDETRWFVGRVASIQSAGEGAHEQVTYTLRGPFADLDNLVMQMNWAGVEGVDKWSSHLLVNWKAPNQRASIREVLLAILNFAVNCGANLQVGNVLSGEGEDAYAPINEYRDVTCGELIRQELRWIPQAVTWFDYTTTPPTFHCGWYTHFAEVELGLSELTRVDIQPRYDLKRPSVVLRYEIRGEIDGSPILEILVDRAPSDATGRELGAFVQTIDARGVTVTNEYVRLVTAQPNLGSVDWWISHAPQLAGEGVSNVSINEYYPDDDAYLYELVEGQIPDWLDIDTYEANVSALISYTYTDPETSEVSEVSNAPFSATYLSVPVQSGIYAKIPEIEYGDLIWLGLANVLYQHHSSLRFDGSIELVESECSGRVGMNNRLSIIGGRSEWDPLNAQIQSISEDIATGTTEIVFGPPKHLEASDLISVLR